MYKSSPITNVYKFILPAFIIIGVIIGLYKSWTEGSAEFHGFGKAMIIVSAWILIFIVQIPFRLKYIQTTDKGIIIKDLGKERIVDYKDIDWITKFDFTSPWFITIKYHEKDTGKGKRIAFLPKNGSAGSFVDDEMTKFIRDKIITENMNYEKDSQPSQIKNFILLMISLLLVLLLAIYFMRDSL